MKIRFNEDKEIVEAVKEGSITEEHIEESVLRILKLKIKLGIIQPN